VSNTIHTDVQTTDYGSTEQNRRDSPLLRLPGELRNKIYEHVLFEGEYSNRDVNASDAINGKNPPCERLLSDSIPNRLGALRICQQTYEEAALLPFTLNVFNLVNLYDLEVMKYRLTFPQRRAITRIYVTTMARGVSIDLEDLKNVRGRNNRSISAYLPGVREVNVMYRMPLQSTIFGGSESFKKEENELKDWLQGSNGDVSVVLKYGYLRHEC
jgi:hypothetical protein